MAADPNYNGCKYNCQKDCKEIDYIVLPQYFPIDFKKECSGKKLLQSALQAGLQKRHFSFLNYKALVEGRIEGRVIDDSATSFYNGSMCQDYIRDFVALVSVEGPTSAVILTNRDNRIFIYDQIAAVGGNHQCSWRMVLSSSPEVALGQDNPVHHLQVLLHSPRGFIQSRQYPAIRTCQTM